MRRTRTIIRHLDGASAALVIASGTGSIRQLNNQEGRKEGRYNVSEREERPFRPIIRDVTRRLSPAVRGEPRSPWEGETAGRHREVLHVRVREDEAPEHIAMLLGLVPHETCVIRSRKFRVDGRTVMLADSYVRASVARGTRIAEENTGPGGLYARLYDLGHRVTSFREDMYARYIMTDEHNAGLGTADLDIVQVILRTASDAQGRPVEVTEMIADAAAFTFRYEFEV